MLTASKEPAGLCFYTVIMAVFRIFCKRMNCDTQMISGAGGRASEISANAATAKRSPWQLAGEMLKWIADGQRRESLIPIAVGEDSIAFPRRSVKAGVE